MSPADTSPPGSSNPYASPEMSGAPRYSTAAVIGKIIAVSMLLVVGICMLPVGFYIAWFVGGLLAAAVFPMRAAGELVALVALGCGAFGATATAAGFGWLIRSELRRPTRSLSEERPFQEPSPPA